MNSIASGNIPEQAGCDSQKTISTFSSTADTSQSMGLSLHAAAGGHPPDPDPTQPLRAGAEMAPEAIGKVLVVDDNVELADMAEMLLAAHGLDAVVAYSGEEALSALAAYPEVRAVVSDIVMPGMSGIDLAAEIAERYPSVKIVLVSGFVSPAVSHVQPLKHTLLAKPYRIEHLISVLHSLC